MSEAEPIGVIAKKVWADIRRQAENDRRRSVVAAVGDFLSGKSKPEKPRRIQTPRESDLFSKAEP